MKTHEMKEKELRPCPFCGAAPRLIDGDSLLNIVCPSLRSQCCGPETGWRDKADAIAAWNRRPASDSALKALRVAEDALRAFVRSSGDEGAKEALEKVAAALASATPQGEGKGE